MFLRKSDHGVHRDGPWEPRGKLCISQLLLCIKHSQRITKWLSSHSAGAALLQATGLQGLTRTLLHRTPTPWDPTGTQSMLFMAMTESLACIRGILNYKTYEGNAVYFLFQVCTVETNNKALPSGSWYGPAWSIMTHLHVTDLPHFTSLKHKTRSPVFLIFKWNYSRGRN